MPNLETHSIVAPATIAFIGLGKMGVPLANNLASAGYQVKAWTRSMHRPTDLSASVTFCPYLKAVAEEACVVILMLADDRAVDSVLFGTGLAESLPLGCLVIDMGTSGPLVAKQHASRLESQRCEYLDAPVSGGVAGAVEAKLTIFVGGDALQFNRARPLFEALGTPHHLGAHGAGQTAKLANQIIVAVTIAAVAEGLSFGERQGLNSNDLLQALQGGFADSQVMRTHGPRMAQRDFSAGGAIYLHLKDLKLAQQTSPVSFGTLVHAKSAADTFQSLADQGASSLDHSAYMLTYLE